MRVLQLNHSLILSYCAHNSMNSAVHMWLKTKALSKALTWLWSYRACKSFWFACHGGQASYFSVTEAPHNIESLRVSREETFCFFETWIPEWVSSPRSPTFQAGSFNHGTSALASSVKWLRLYRWTAAFWRPSWKIAAGSEWAGELNIFLTTIILRH